MFFFASWWFFTNPSEKNMSQNGNHSSPNFGVVNIKKICWNHTSPLWVLRWKIFTGSSLGSSWKILEGSTPVDVCDFNRSPNGNPTYNWHTLWFDIQTWVPHIGYINRPLDPQSHGFLGIHGWGYNDPISRYTYIYLHGCFQKIGFSPQIIPFSIGFKPWNVHHRFWGISTPIFWKHPYPNVGPTYWLNPLILKSPSGWPISLFSANL